MSTPEPWEKCWRCGGPHCDVYTDIETKTSIECVAAHRLCIDKARAVREAERAADPTPYTKVHFTTEDGQSGESMWVEILEGDENNGVGVLRNTPVLFPMLKNGSKVRYESQDPTKWPEFVERLD